MSRSVVLIILLSGLISCSAPTELDKGIEAYHRQDYTEAIGYLRGAASSGNPDAAYYMGKMYARGLGVEIDAETAQQWFQIAIDTYSILATKGHVNAQAKLCFMMSSGKGIRADYAEAFRWCDKAANQDETAAQRNLAILYGEGLGVRKDLEQSTHWYRKYVETACDTPYTEQNCTYPELCVCKGASTIAPDT